MNNILYIFNENYFFNRKLSVNNKLAISPSFWWGFSLLWFSRDCCRDCRRWCKASRWELAQSTLVHALLGKKELIAIINPVPCFNWQVFLQGRGWWPDHTQVYLKDIDKAQTYLPLNCKDIPQVWFCLVGLGHLIGITGTVQEIGLTEIYFGFIYTRPLQWEYFEIMGQTSFTS